MRYLLLMLLVTISQSILGQTNSWFPTGFNHNYDSVIQYRFNGNWIENEFTIKYNDNIGNRIIEKYRGNWNNQRILEEKRITLIDSGRISGRIWLVAGNMGGLDTIRRSISNSPDNFTKIDSTFNKINGSWLNGPITTTKYDSSGIIKSHIVTNHLSQPVSTRKFYRLSGTLVVDTLWYGLNSTIPHTLAEYYLRSDGLLSKDRWWYYDSPNFIFGTEYFYDSFGELDSLYHTHVGSTWKLFDYSTPDQIIVTKFNPTPDSFEYHIKDVYYLSTKTNLINSTLINPVKLYPNPSNGLIQIHYDKPINDPGQLRIFDLNGRLRFQDKLISNKLLCDLTSFQQGIYVIEVKFDDQKFRDKLIILK